MAQQGHPAPGAKLFEAAYERQRAVGTDEDTPIYGCMFAETLSRLGRHERARREIEEMPAEMDRIGVCNWLPEVWRLLGETTRRARPGEPETALHAFEMSARIAASQGTRMLRIRTLVSIAAMLEGDDREEVFDQLEVLLAAVEHCGDSIDLRRANEMLAHHRPAHLQSARSPLPIDGYARR